MPRTNRWMRARPFVLVALCLVAMSASACSFPGTDCISIGVFGIHVTVVDAATSQPLSGATVTLVDGSYTENLFLGSATNASVGMYGALERAGVYSVTVAAAGYQTWSQNSVVVRRAGSCNSIQPTTVSARLTRINSAT